MGELRNQCLCVTRGDRWREEEKKEETRKTQSRLEEVRIVLGKRVDTLQAVRVLTCK